MHEWVRIFSIVLKMNKIDINVSDKNPYMFEEQELKFSKPQATPEKLQYKKSMLYSSQTFVD